VIPGPLSLTLVLVAWTFGACVVLVLWIGAFPVDDGRDEG